MLHRMPAQSTSAISCICETASRNTIGTAKTSGASKSVAAELRVKYTATYQKLIAQLAALLPSEDEKAAAQELMEFINREE